MNEPLGHKGAGTGLTPGTIRVAHVGALVRSSASGVDRTLEGLVSNLAGQGVETEVWHPSPLNRTISELRSGGVEVVELPVYPRATSAVLGLPRATREFIRRRSADVDVLHLHSVFTPHNVWISRTAGLPFVVTPNGGYNVEVLHGRHRSAKAVWMWMHERRYVRAASTLHAVAPSELGQLRETFGVDELAFAPNGVELPSVVSDPASKTESSPKRVVFVGRLAVQHKGLDLLVGGYARFADRHADADVELVIAGPDERSGRAQLEALENAHPARRDIRFPGPVFGEAKDDLVRSAWFFVHPSRWEGMPFAVLEAIALGIPVLVTPETNLASFVRDAGAGIVIEGSADGVADGLASICDVSDERYAAMSDAARELAATQFSWPSIAGRIARVYRSILSEP